MTKPIGIAVVGFGRWGTNLARVYAASADFELVAIADVDVFRRRESARIHPITPTFSHIDDVLNLASVQALAIATPPVTLSSLAATAIAKGRHVFVEKPGAATSAEAFDLAEMAEARQRILFVDFTPMWSPLHQTTSALLATGALGRLVSWRAERTNFDRSQPGIDVLRDLAVHDLAMLDALVPARPDAVAIVDGESDAHGRLIAAHLRLTYLDGLVADIFVSWNGEEYRRRTRIEGSKATAIRDDVNDPERLRVEVAGKLARIEPTTSSGEPLARAAQAFALAIRTGVTPPTDARAAERVLDWIDDAERAFLGRKTAASRIESGL